MTSQIFANIYLNEFDRFVRQVIKPYAYLRYGDDFLVIMQDEQSIVDARRTAADWLASQLKLHIHTKNDVVIPVKRGLHFLGHDVYPFAPLSVDRHMRQKIAKTYNSTTAASYQAMAVPRRFRKRLPWLLLDDQV